jgi:prepilin-type N-terminal cleavage/methylation domain-containing protein
MHIRGSSLIESLVAMSVFSIGSAATGAWFFQTTFNDARASRLLAANAIAATLEARMRSNAMGVADGHYTMSSEAAACARSCNAAALAADDLRRFRKALVRRVGPSAEGVVRCETSSRCVIRIGCQGREVLAWPLDL